MCVGLESTLFFCTWTRYYPEMVVILWHKHVLRGIKLQSQCTQHPSSCESTQTGLPTNFILTIPRFWMLFYGTLKSVVHSLSSRFETQTSVSFNVFPLLFVPITVCIQVKCPVTSPTEVLVYCSKVEVVPQEFGPFVVLHTRMSHTHRNNGTTCKNICHPAYFFGHHPSG